MNPVIAVLSLKYIGGEGRMCLSRFLFTQSFIASKEEYIDAHKTSHFWCWGFGRGSGMVFGRSSSGRMGT